MCAWPERNHQQGLDNRYGVAVARLALVQEYPDICVTTKPATSNLRFRISIADSTRRVGLGVQQCTHRDPATPSIRSYGSPAEILGRDRDSIAVLTARKKARIARVGVEGAAGKTAGSSRRALAAAWRL
ncbi:hypothetical protein ON010_g7727 [Phytophthora cinnamomi]|nr:hypothetical protein ON010_g7727 [Phytophthora cinnamomi]